MSVATHTPGPWTLLQQYAPELRADAVSPYILGPDNATVASAHYFATRHGSITPAEQMANARLIAAAPEMLDALKAAQQFLSPEIDRGPGVAGWENTVALVADAIAKASGGQHG